MTTSHAFNAPPVHLEQAMPLAEMSVALIAALPPAQLQEAHTNLLALQAMVKSVLDRMHTALEQRYAQQAQAARLANGRDFGVCHVSDGELRVSVDLPKKVSWDQTQLAAIAARIAGAGDRVQDYIDTDYSVSESLAPTSSQTLSTIAATSCRKEFRSGDGVTSGTGAARS